MTVLEKMYNTLSTYNFQKITTADPFITSYVFLFLQIGARVLKKDFLRRKRKGGKMDPQWLGPYEVTKDLGKGFYTLSDPNTGVVFVKGSMVLILRHTSLHPHRGLMIQLQYLLLRYEIAQ